jgi:hypothetical protein
MEKLIEYLNKKIEKLSSVNSKIDLSKKFFDTLYSVYPFNRFEYIIIHLISMKIIDLQQYICIRDEYLGRNKYLYLFEITAPRTFGETWAQRHLNEIVPELQRPSSQLDKEYSGQYDFWYKGIRIEVKASRAVKRKSGESLIIKALSSDSPSGFDMNFQQIKPSCCDIFVWIGVWRDMIRYWVLSSNDIENNKYYSKGQHRGNIGEGQLWLKENNIDEFEIFEVTVRNILEKIIEKSNKFI